MATAVLFAAAAYLFEKEKPYIIALLPAAVCLLIVFTYILQAPEGLRLPGMLSNIISVIATVIVTGLFIKKCAKGKSLE